MTPNQLQDNAQAILDLYAQAEETMLRAVARRAAKGVTQPGWAERKLAEVQELEQEIRDELRQLSKSSLALRNGLLNGAYQSGWDLFSKEIKQLTGGNIRAIPPSRFNTSLGIINELNQSFDALHSAILRATSDAYRDVIGKAVAALSTGTITSRQAIKQALNEFADRGITGFTDKAGRHWQMDSYAEMAVRTGMARAIRQGYTDDMQAHDEHLVIISDHQDTCPLCIDWERSVLAIDDAGLNHPDCDGSLAEAEAAGLFHPNCQHSMTVYVPGLTIKASGKSTQGYTREQDLQGYQNRQKQRSMERQVRAWKRRQAVALTPEDERYARAKVQLWQQRLREHVDNTGLPRLYYREGGRVTLSAAARKLPPTKLPGMATPKRETEAEKWLRLTGHSFDGYTPDQQKELRKLFESAPPEIQAVYEKYASNLQAHSEYVQPGYDAYYSRGDHLVHYHSSEIVQGNSRDLPYTTHFHEYGHNLDAAAGGHKSRGDFSALWRDKQGRSFADIINGDVERLFKGVFSNDRNVYAFDLFSARNPEKYLTDILDRWCFSSKLKKTDPTYQSLRTEILGIKSRYVSDYEKFIVKHMNLIGDTLYNALSTKAKDNLIAAVTSKVSQEFSARYKDLGNFGDFLQGYTETHYFNFHQFILGSGHLKGYFNSIYGDDNRSTEAFAECMEAYVTNPRERECLEKYLPDTCQAFFDILKEMLQ